MSEEIKSVEVFGTKEVSVKEFMGSSDKSLVLLSDYEKAKENLVALKEKHESRVSELVQLDVLSPSELKELNTIRGELREPRYLVQNIEKNNISVFEAYKKTDKANLKELIDINRELEDKASEKIKLEDERKKLEKEAEAKAEELRIEKIKSDIDNVETYCLEVIQKMTFDNMKTSCESIGQSLNADYDFEEYDLLFDQVKDRVAKLVFDKTNDITARENQRLENEAMKKEIFEVRVNRFKELGFISDKNDVFRSTELAHTYLKSELMNIDSATFERAIENIKKAKEEVEQAKRDAEIKCQKDEQFDVRKNRLFELGFNITDNLHFFFSKEFPDVSVNTEVVFQASVTEFEEILSKAKQGVLDAEKKKEADELAEQEKRKQEAIAKKKADAENKARVKRLAKDKESISSALALIRDTVIGEIVFRKYDNEETENFRAKLEVDFDKFIDDCLTQLKEL